MPAQIGWINMHAATLRAITAVFVAVCLCDGAVAAERGRSRHAPAPVQGSAPWWQSADRLETPLRATGGKQKVARTRAAWRDPYADPAAPYKANRLSLPRASQPIVNIPGQTTVLTRQILDDKNATSLKDALRTTAGVTVGR